jgi:hypothetical protein
MNFPASLTYINSTWSIIDDLVEFRGPYSRVRPDQRKRLFQVATAIIAQRDKGRLAVGAG